MHKGVIGLTFLRETEGLAVAEGLHLTNGRERAIDAISLPLITPALSRGPAKIASAHTVRAHPARGHRDLSPIAARASLIVAHLPLAPPAALADPVS